MRPSVTYTLNAMLDLYGEGNVDPGGTTNWGALFHNTAKFDGIQFFADAAETIVVGDIPIISTLGFDYSAFIAAPEAVPEPGSLALMIGGLGILGCIIKRRSYT